MKSSSFFLRDKALSAKSSRSNGASMNIHSKYSLTKGGQENIENDQSMMLHHYRNKWQLAPSLWLPKFVSSSVIALDSKASRKKTVSKICKIPLNLRSQIKVSSYRIASKKMSPSVHSPQPIVCVHTGSAHMTSGKTSTTLAVTHG